MSSREIMIAERMIGYSKARQDLAEILAELKLVEIEAMRKIFAAMDENQEAYERSLRK